MDPIQTQTDRLPDPDPTPDPIPAPAPVLLTFAAIMAADDLAPETVPMPAWHGAVVIRPLTAGELTACSEAAQIGDGHQGTKTDNTRFVTHLLAASLVTPALTLAEAAAAYAQRSSAAIMHLVKRVNALNGQAEDAPAVTEAEFRPVAPIATDV